FPGTVGHGTKLRRILSHGFSTEGRNSGIINPFIAALTTFSTCPNKLRRIRVRDMRGTAGQKGLSPTLTTINCPTEVSRFWDARDTFVGQKTSECELEFALRFSVRSPQPT